MSNRHSSQGFLDCMHDYPTAHRPMGVKIAWVPEHAAPNYPDMVTPGHYTIRLYENDGEYAACFEHIDLFPEDFQEVYNAFVLGARQADDERREDEKKREKVSK